MNLIHCGAILLGFVAVDLQAQLVVQPGSPASAPPSFQTKQPTATVAELSAKLRLSITSNVHEPNAFARIAGISICSAAQCIDVAAPSSVPLSITSQGQSTAIAEYSLPFMDVESIRFKSLPGPGLLQGEADLPQALRLTAETSRGAVLIVAQRQGAGFAVQSAAANYWNPEGITFFYNPTFPTVVNLPHGVKLTLPAGATSSPQVFYVAVHDTGDEYPLIDVYPQVRLVKAGRVEVPAIVRRPKTVQGPNTVEVKPLVMEIGTPAYCARASASEFLVNETVTRLWGLTMGLR